MEELIQKENIDVNVKAKHWEDAIRKAGQLLIDSKRIDETYVNNMVDSVKEMGPYIVLTHGFALAHAAPSEKDVYVPSVSLVTLEEPIKFGSPNDPVKVVMCLACKDKATHMDLLSKIAHKLMKADFIESISNCSSKDELYNAINEERGGKK